MNRKIKRVGGIVITIVLLASIFTLPINGKMIGGENKHIIPTKTHNLTLTTEEKNNILTQGGQPASTEQAWLDTNIYREEETTVAVEQNDIGYNKDVGDKIQRSMFIYVGEPIDGAPGRGRTAYLNPDEGDNDDYYRFSVCEGQTITASISTTEDYSYELLDYHGTVIPSGYTATETEFHFLHVYGNPNADEGEYTINIALNGQNDAGTNSDAGDSIDQATSITPGSYVGYMDMNDPEDWYSFSVNSGQGIFVTVKAYDRKLADFDISLYNPSGTLVHRAKYYGDDELEYPADETGTWKIKLDMFPGWDTTKWPDDYFLYGSGAYELELNIGGTAQPPPGPIPQPEIHPIAQTFTVTNDPESSDDEYNFLAAIPSAVYQENGKQYVSPIVYTDDPTPTHWFGTADNTTQYLLDDWNTYLSRHGVTPETYELAGDPVKTAAKLATAKWSSSDTAVLTIDGSKFKDTVTSFIDQDDTLNVKTKVTSASPGSNQFIDFEGHSSIPLWIGKEWGVMTIYAFGSNCGQVGLITPRYELGTAEDWPHPYDGPGDNTNIYFPISIPGLYLPYIDDPSGFDTFEITQHSCNRYKIPISDSDCSIKVTVTTNEESYLEVFLVDPTGSIRRPSVPHWNGGPINPIHIWNGDHHNGFEHWRRWEPTYSKEHTVEIHYPMTGKWTAIVAPHYPYGQEKTTDTIDYHITIEIREHNPERINAGLSAANGAVLASLQHAPLLYVTETTVPIETQNALEQLGVNNILFVNINHVSKVKLSGQVTEITSIKDAVHTTNVLKQQHHIPASMDMGNIITITSFGTEDGFFAPAGLIAAYHATNVINIGEIPDAYNFLDKATAWREYAGSWYHGCRAQGHLEKMSEPIDLIQIILDMMKGEFPPLGIDQHLRWWGTVHDTIKTWITNLGLEGAGQEVYIFVAPRDTDIRHPVIRVMSGVGSYAGQFPFETPGLDAALMCRDILYPAIIYANPGRNITTSQLMNFPDGWNWKTNDGNTSQVYSSRELKETFSSHGRFYEGHVIWDNWLERINEGACVNYYSGHGTGGSGISAQYKNVAEAFPDAELRHEYLHDFDWWDAWRGYMYDDEQTKTARWGGFTWYNAKEPNLYDIIHFKWVDQLLQNLHSEIELWMSCTTGQHFGPDIYLEHGSALWYGNAGTGLCPQEDLLDDSWIHDMMVDGLPVGEAFSKYVWLHQRDFTAKDDAPAKYQAALYGSSSLTVTNVQVIYGDPTLICYSPEWIEPIPVKP